MDFALQDTTEDTWTSPPYVTSPTSLEDPFAFRPDNYLDEDPFAFPPDNDSDEDPFSNLASVSPSPATQLFYTPVLFPTSTTPLPLPQNRAFPFSFPLSDCTLSSQEDCSLPSTGTTPSSCGPTPPLHHLPPPTSSTPPDPAPQVNIDELLEEIPFSLESSRNKTTLVQIGPDRFQKKRANKDGTVAFRCSRYKTKCAATVLMSKGLTRVAVYKNKHNH